MTELTYDQRKDKTIIYRQRNAYFNDQFKEKLGIVKKNHEGEYCFIKSMFIDDLKEQDLEGLIKIISEVRNWQTYQNYAFGNKANYLKEQRFRILKQTRN